MLLLLLFVALSICAWRYAKGHADVTTCSRGDDNNNNTAQQNSGDVELTTKDKPSNSSSTSKVSDKADDNDDDNDDTRKPKPSPALCRARCCVCCHSAVSVVAFVLLVLPLIGAAFEASGYLMYPPDGEFFTLTHNRTPSGCVITQRILTNCMEPDNYNTSLPTIWSEVGGGGHSMSDLWGLRDELVNVHGRRFCSYDIPGTGWSDPGLSGTGTYPNGGEKDSGGYITDLLMDAMGETGPFVLMGSMDGSPNRAQRFALDHPAQALAFVSVGVSYGEMRQYRDYHNVSDEELLQYARAQYSSRQGGGIGVLLFAIPWGLLSAFVPVSDDYVPQSRAREHLFLNLFNDKQWATNVDFIRYQLQQSAEELVADPYVLTETANLVEGGTKMIIFDLARTEEQLADRCWEGLDSDSCGLSNFSYAATVKLIDDIVDLANATVPGSIKPIICRSECANVSGTHLMNQGPMIPWFSQQLIDALDELGV